MSGVQAAREPLYVSVAEAAEIIGIDRRSVYNMVKRGAVQCFVVMGKKALLRSEVLEYRPRQRKDRRR